MSSLDNCRQCTWCTRIVLAIVLIVVGFGSKVIVKSVAKSAIINSRVKRAVPTTTQDPIDWINDIYYAQSNTQGTVNDRVNLQTTTQPTTSVNQQPASGDCQTRTNLEGKCVMPLYCSVPPEPLNPEDSFDLRQGNPCNSGTHCCPLALVLQPKKTQTPPSSSKRVCGVSYPGGYRLREGSPQGSFSVFAEFPWMVALLRPNAGAIWQKGDYIGGGTLIHPSVVLTVAHKVQNMNLKCRAGDWDASMSDEARTHQDRDVQRTMIHEQYNYSKASHDVALLFLKEPFVLEDVYHIGLACLGGAMPAAGTRCYSMGWGKSLDNPEYVTLLKKVELPLVDRRTCTSQLRRTKLRQRFSLHETLMCAGGEEGTDTCTGDGGSSLVCPLPDYDVYQRHAVYGMVAYGVGDNCGRKNVPGVYARVPSILDWINRKMDAEGLNKDYLIQ